jgi:hypothetical protein
MTGSTEVTFCGKHGDEYVVTVGQPESMPRLSRPSNDEARGSFWRRSKRHCGQADIVLYR